MTKIKETNKLERYVVMAFDGKKWGRLSRSLNLKKVTPKSKSKFIETMESVTVGDTFEFEEDAIEFAKKSWKTIGKLCKAMEVAEIVVIETTTVTNIVDEDNAFALENP